MYIKSKVKRGGKSAIWPNCFCRQSMRVLSTPPSSTCRMANFVRSFNLIERVAKGDASNPYDFNVELSIKYVRTAKEGLTPMTPLKYDLAFLNCRNGEFMITRVGK